MPYLAKLKILQKFYIRIRREMICKIQSLFPYPRTHLWLNFHEDPISRLFLHKVANRQTDKRRLEHNLLSRGNITLTLIN